MFFILFAAITAVFVPVVLLIQCGKKKAKSTQGQLAGANLKAIDRPVEPGEKKDPHDDQYQTMAGLGNSRFESPAPQSGAATEVKASDDPNYMTMAGLGNEQFGGAAKPPQDGPPPGGPQVKAADDPNYMTMAGLENDKFGK